MTDERELDDKLAQFADDLLAQKDQQALSRSDDPQIRALEEALLRMMEARPGEPDPQLRMRVRSRLSQAWEENHPVPAPLKNSPGKRKRLSFGDLFRVNAFAPRLALVLVVIVVLVGVLLLVPPETGGLTGTATGSFPLPILLGFAVIVILVYLYFRRRP